MDPSSDESPPTRQLQRVFLFKMGVLHYCAAKYRSNQRSLQPKRVKRLRVLIPQIPSRFTWEAARALLLALNNIHSPDRQVCLPNRIAWKDPENVS